MITVVIKVEKPDGKIQEWKKQFKQYGADLFVWFIESIKPTLSKQDKVVGDILEWHKPNA